MSKTESITLPESYLSLKLGKAAKAGARSQGAIYYRILTDTERRELYITLVANDSSGCFSREIVPFARIEQCLHGLDVSKPITSKLFQSCFISRSQNNAGFLAAVLRQENLLKAVPESAHQHALAPDWLSWKTAMLALADTAEPYRPEPPKPRGGSINKTVKVEAESTAELASAQSSTPPSASEPDHPEQDEVTAELSEAEMDLLQQRGMDEITHTSDEALAEAGSGEVVDHRHGKKPRRDKLEHPSHRGGRS
ncbi:MAG: hypothetical protein ACR65R_15960 [Methylomicrobium sp.]